MFSLSSGGVPYLKAVLREAGLDPEKDVTMVPTGAGAPALQALNSGTVAALSLWAGAFAVFENQGAKLTIFTSKELSTAPGHVLATTDEYIQQEPGRRREGRADLREISGVRHGQPGSRGAGLLESAAAEPAA